MYICNISSYYRIYLFFYCTIFSMTIAWVLILFLIFTIFIMMNLFSFASVSCYFNNWCRNKIFLTHFHQRIVKCIFCECKKWARQVFSFSLFMFLNSWNIHLIFFILFSIKMKTSSSEYIFRIYSFTDTFSKS